MASSAAGVLAVALVASVPGSPLHPALPEGAGPSGPFAALADALGVDRLRGGSSVAAGVVALALALAGFLLVLRAAWAGRLGVRLVVGLAIAYHVAVLFLPLLFSRDVHSYVMYGRIAGAYGENPYVSTPKGFPEAPVYALVGPKWRDTPAVYGPGFTLLSAGVARATDDLPSLIVVYRAIAAAASLGTLLIVVRLALRFRPERAAFAAALLGLNPVWLFQSVGSGHNDLLVSLSIAGALALAIDGRTVVAAAALALGALVKAPAALPLLLLVVWATARRPRGERLRAFAAHAGVAAGIGLAAAAPFLQTKDPTLGMAELTTHEGWLAPSRFVGRTLGGLAGWVGGDAAEDVVHTLVRLAFAVAVVAGVTMLARAVARRMGMVAPAVDAPGAGAAAVVRHLGAPGGVAAASRAPLGADRSLVGPGRVAVGGGAVAFPDGVRRERPLRALRAGARGDRAARLARARPGAAATRRSAAARGGGRGSRARRRRLRPEPARTGP